MGHGPSLKDKGLGGYIDSFDRVVRLKGCYSVVKTPDYGSSTDAVCASTEVMGTFFKIEAQEYWAYPKKGFFDENTVIDAIARLEKPVLLPLNYCNYWNRRFRRTGACHPNVSTGMAAVLIAIKRWSPKEIHLAGFDAMLNPGLAFDRNPEIPRTGAGEYPNHDWKKENELLTVLSDIYRVKILPMTGSLSAA